MKKNIKLKLILIIVVCIIFIGYVSYIFNKNEIKNNDSPFYSEEHQIKKIYNLDTIDYKSVLKLERDEKFAAQLNDGRIWFPVAVNDNGVVYGNTQKYNDKIDFISYDLNTKEYNIISTTFENSNNIFVEDNDNYIFWIEEKNENGAYKSIFKLFNKNTKLTKIIAESDNIYTSIKPLSLGDNYVLWVEHKVSENQTYPIIQKYLINTEEYSIYKENATSPVICNDFIAYLGPDENNNIALFIDDLNNNKVIQVTKDLDINAIEGYNNTLVISYSENSNKKLAIYENKQIIDILIAENTDYKFEYPQISNNFITWASLSQTMVYDRKSKKLLLLDSSDESAKIIISDNYIIHAKTRQTFLNGEEQTKSEAIKNGMYLNDIYVKKISN